MILYKTPITHTSFDLRYKRTSVARHLKPNKGFESIDLKKTGLEF